ncbi:MAG: tetratricopeptide repeat protein [Desulfobulbaceae bacterium]
MRISAVAREYLLLLLLVAVPAVSYLNCLDGRFVFDDARIYTSPAVKLEKFSLTGVIHAVQGMEPATRPVANLSFVLNYLAHGFAVRGYHLVNLAVHITAGVLLYFFLKTTLALPVLRDHHRFAEAIPFASALLWLVHPLQTQAVSYIVQRMTSLSALFFVLSLLLYARGRMTGSADRRVLLLGGSILSGLLALGSKEIAVTLPLFVLIYEWFFVQDLRRKWLADNKKYLMSVGIFLLVIPLLFLGDKPWSVLAGGYATRDFSLAERVLTEFRVVLFYLGLLAFPHPGRLSIEHEFVLSTSLVSPVTTLPAIAAVIMLLALAVAMAPKYRLESFCILWFLGNHLVEGSVLPLELVFEHRNYLPSMMLIPLAVGCTCRFITNKAVLSVLLCLVVAFFSSWTYQRNFVWQDELSLWRDAVRKAPNSARVHNNLAVELKRAGKFADAVTHYRETIRLDPGFVEAYYNLGNVLMLQGDLQQAVRSYRQAVELNPGLVVLQMSLANGLFDLGRYEEAKIHYLQAARLDPGNVEARMNLERATMMLNTLKQNRGKREGG